MRENCSCIECSQLSLELFAHYNSLPTDAHAQLREVTPVIGLLSALADYLSSPIVAASLIMRC